MDEVQYQNFDLTFIPNGEAYLVKVQSSVGEATGKFVVPFTQTELTKFHLFTAPGRSIRRVHKAELGLQIEFGERLFDAVFTGELLGRYYTSLQFALGKNARLRIRVRLSDAPVLAELPWEYLYNPSPERFLARHQDTPIVRYLETSEPVRHVDVRLPLKVLVVIYNPNDSAYARLDVEQEWENLNGALRELEQKGLLSLDLLEDATPAALRKRLRENEYHVFHFIGHGGFDEETREGILLMKGEHGKSRKVSSRSLGWDLYEHKTLALAVLNACEGARPDSTDIFSGTAQSLIQQGIPAVVAMQREITDDAAKEFAKAFYSALSKGYPLEYAITMSRQEIVDKHEMEWATPVLFMRSPDGYLFDLKSAPVDNKVAEVEQHVNITTEVTTPEDEHLSDEVLQVNEVTKLEERKIDSGKTLTVGVEQVFDTEVISLQNGFRLKLLKTLSPVEVGKKSGIVGRAHFLEGGKVLYVKHLGKGASSGEFVALLNMPEGDLREGTDIGYSAVKNLLHIDTFGSPASGGGRNGYGYSYLNFRDEEGQLFNWMLDNSAPNFEARFSHDTNQLVFVSTAGSKRIRVWKVPNWPNVRGETRVFAISYVFPVPANAVDVDLSFDGRFVGCATNDQYVRLWDTDTGQPLRHLDQGQGNKVNRVVFSSNGNALASATTNGVVRIWPSLDGAEGHALVGNQHKTTLMAFSPDGTILATGSLQSVVYMWNVSNGSMICSIDLRRDRLNMNAFPSSIEFSPDGRVLACGMYDGFVRLLGIPS